MNPTRVADTVTLDAPKTAEWYLQSDTPFEGTGNRFRNGKAGEPALRVSFALPKDVAVTTAEAAAVYVGVSFLVSVTPTMARY